MLSRRQKLALDAMEIPVWKIRPEPDSVIVAMPVTEPDTEVDRPPLPEHVELSAQHMAQHDSVPVPDSIRDSTRASAEVPVRPDVDNLPDLQVQVAACQACELAGSRSQTVFGSGNAHARLMLIGEAPGAEEDKQGLPFVGAAGHLLSEMLYAIGLQRDQVYIANMVKCRPPHNRDPNNGEMQACEHFLHRQIELIRPGLILVLGRVAAQYLLHSPESVAHLRENSHCYSETDIPLMVSYHPAHLLRTPQDKAKVWQDLKKVQTFLGDV